MSFHGGEEEFGRGCLEQNFTGAEMRVRSGGGFSLAVGVGSEGSSHWLQFRAVTRVDRKSSFFLWN